MQLVVDWNCVSIRILLLWFLVIRWIPSKTGYFGRYMPCGMIQMIIALNVCSVAYVAHSLLMVGHSSRSLHIYSYFWYFEWTKPPIYVQWMREHNKNNLIFIEEQKPTALCSSFFAPGMLCMQVNIVIGFFGVQYKHIHFICIHRQSGHRVRRRENATAKTHVYKI